MLCSLQTQCLENTFDCKTCCWHRSVCKAFGHPPAEEAVLGGPESSSALCKPHRSPTQHPAALAAPTQALFANRLALIPLLSATAQGGPFCVHLPMGGKVPQETPEQCVSLLLAMLCAHSQGKGAD